MWTGLRHDLRTQVSGPRWALSSLASAVRSSFTPPGPSRIPLFHPYHPVQDVPLKF